jgi:hypothetical protein
MQATKKLRSNWMKEDCLLLAHVGLPILETLFNGDQLPGLQRVQVLAFQMPVPSQVTHTLAQSQHEHTRTVNQRSAVQSQQQIGRKSETETLA